jgi:D-lactate dehydrogenase (cytochrome)
VVTPAGDVIRTGGRARKSAAGYDLTRLYIGSEGTLGIITEVQLRLFGVPEVIASAVCQFETLDARCRR